LYYQGSWQLVLRPSKTIDTTPAALNIPFEEIHFDSSETGQPRLTGWWIPAISSSATGSLQSAPKFASDTILYLHDGTGSLSAATPTLGLLHSIGVSVFAIDYRGFGHSDASSHPTSETMARDASAALTYLTGTRHLAPDRVVPYGAGLGASLAVGLAKSHGELPAMIVDNPDPDPALTAVAAHSSGLVPIRLLYHEHFEIAGPLASLTTPKLLLSGGPNARASEDLEHLFRSAASPAMSVVLPRSDYQAAYTEALSRFLDQYLPGPPRSR
jgi:pimeloyl-ACP methyl ester carboxylesterase